MKTLWIDLETFSSVPIDHGTHAYAAQAEVLLWAFAIDSGPVKVWDLTEGGPMPAELHAAWEDPSVKIIAHNYQFERTVLNARGYHSDIRRWRCSMAMALAHSLPGGLERLSNLFGLGEEQGKISDGRRLVLKFCKPQGVKAKVKRRTRLTDPEDWAKFVEYCGRDVEAMRTLIKRMPRFNWTADEVERFHTDGVINERGFAVDLDLARAAVVACDAEQRRLADLTVELTDGAVASATQRDALLRYLREECGMEITDLKAGTIEVAVERGDLPQDMIDLLCARLQASTVSTKKYASVLKATSLDGRLRGTLQFRGAARTGRFAGRVFQPHNLPRPPKHLSKKDVLIGIDALKAGVADLIVDNVMELASAALRGLIVAPSGRKLVVVDLANIEGRIVAWLAGEEWKLDAFRAYDAKQGPDLYRLSYARAFHCAPEEVDGDQRQIGKVMELALGYQGAVGAFSTMAAAYGVTLPEEEVLSLVRAWRQAHPNISALWYAIDDAVKNVTRRPNKVVNVGRLVVDAVQRGSDVWLRIKLPSGRFLTYPHPDVDLEDKWSYMGMNQFTRKWERIKSYGGKCVENATQACAADVLLHGIARAESDGYEVVLSVHDEIVAEVPDDPSFNVEGLAHAMTDNPPWATGLPLAAEGYEAARYRK